MLFRVSVRELCMHVLSCLSTRFLFDVRCVCFVGYKLVVLANRVCGGFVSNKIVANVCIV